MHAARGVAPLLFCTRAHVRMALCVYFLYRAEKRAGFFRLCNELQQLCCSRLDAILFFFSRYVQEPPVFEVEKESYSCCSCAAAGNHALRERKLLRGEMCDALYCREPVRLWRVPGEGAAVEMRLCASRALFIFPPFFFFFSSMRCWLRVCGGVVPLRVTWGKFEAVFVDGLIGWWHYYYRKLNEHSENTKMKHEFSQHMGDCKQAVFHAFAI